MTKKRTFKEESESKPLGAFELFQFALHNKKWWLLPLLLLLALASLLVVLAGSGAAPFVYTLF